MAKRMYQDIKGVNLCGKECDRREISLGCDAGRRISILLSCRDTTSKSFVGGAMREG